MIRELNTMSDASTPTNTTSPPHTATTYPSPVLGRVGRRSLKAREKVVLSLI